MHNFTEHFICSRLQSPINISIHSNNLYETEIVLRDIENNILYFHVVAKWLQLNYIYIFKIYAN